MKKLLRLLTFSCLIISSLYSQAQCGAGYTQAQLNWDELDYYWNSGNNIAPYGYRSSGVNQTYISDAMEQTQKFAIGPNYVTIALSSNNMVNPGSGNSAENTTHTGDIPGYTGADVQYNPSSNGQTITLTFNSSVQNLSFALYDIDALAIINVDAYDVSNAKQNVNITLQGSTILTAVNGTAATITAGATSLATNDNRGTAIISVSTTVKKIVITTTSIGTDAVFWLSDINACVSGSFPTNYQQTGKNRPLQGPAGNQPDYFIVTPDNNSAYIVDPVTGNAKLLFTDNSTTYINSFGYDPYNHLLYYISENTSVNSSNRTLKRYDFNTNTSITVVPDITATLGIPTMGSGVESAGASFYDGALYLGIEGGRYSSGTSTKTRETIIWRIDFDASLNPTVAYQVFGTDAYINSSGTSIHDFGDFIIKDGILYDYNTARNGTDYSQSTYHQYDMMKGTFIIYSNPGTTEWNGQAGMTWNGDLYYFRNTSSTTSGIGYYDGNGNNGALVNITVVDGSGAWPSGNGDAAENFRPQVDFGDAPASYDPNPLSPAAHDQDPNLKLGANQDKEWVTKGQTALANSDSYDDGLAYVTNLVPSSGSYLTTVSVYNNTGNPATVCAWLDYNGNGVFDASEGVSVNVPTSTSIQSVDLFWPSLSSSLAIGTYTYLRIRVTYASNNMTTSNPTGYYNGGEVEDYRVYVNTTPLEAKYSDFDAQLTKIKTAKLTWSSQDESNIAYYVIEKSVDNTNWTAVDFSNSKMQAGIVKHETTDMNVAEGITYYRLKTIQKTGKAAVSSIRQVENKTGRFSVLISPNPVTSKAFATISSASVEDAVLQVVNDQGMVVYRNRIRLNAGTNSIELPVAGFASGRYIVNLTTGSKSLHQSLIVNK